MPSRLQARRGEMIDIGGRRLRLVRAGRPSKAPTVLCEAGAFGCAADWGVVQDKLAGQGLYSLAYDRAGLGYSDPGPGPRDAGAVARDLERLLAAAGETGPLVLVGHSMGGLFVRLFAARNPHRVVGLVLVDPMTPEILDHWLGRAVVRHFGHGAIVWALAARAGLIRAIAPAIGDRIGLTGEAGVEKREVYGAVEHNRHAAEEVRLWPRSSDQVRAAPLDPAWPVAVVTARAERGLKRLKAAQCGPARTARSGYVEHVAGCGHANLIGRKFGDPVVRGVAHVLAAAGR